MLISIIDQGTFSKIEIKKFEDDVTLSNSDLGSKMSRKSYIDDAKNNHSSNFSYHTAKDQPDMQKSRETHFDRSKSLLILIYM